MKTTMTFEEWWNTDEVPAGTNRSVLERAWDAALSTQPKWVRWSEVKPTLENEFGSAGALFEFNYKGNHTAGLVAYCIVYALAMNWENPPIAWRYITPSGFAPVKKSDAEVAWEEYSMNSQYPVSKDVFMEVFEFTQENGRKK